MVIKTNVSALTASRNLMETSKGLTASLARLSSGSKLSNPSDNAGGFAVSMRLDAQLNRLAAAEDNVGNALSFSQTQDGYLKKVAKALDRLGELAMLSLDETKSNIDRSLYNTEFVNLQQFVIKTSERDFNGVSMFGANGIGVTIDSDANTFSYTACDLTSATFTSATNSTSCNITTTGNATTALGTVKAALNELASQRAKVGANQSALTMYQDQIGTLRDNLTAANSRIKDVDVAEESTTFAKYNILVQSGTAMLSQANTSSQSVLRLLG
jgi:flagellin